MKIEDMEEGMNVLIGPSITRTDRRFSSCSDMSDMRNKMYRIEYLLPDDNAVSIRGYTFDVRDIVEIEVEIPEKIVHFDAGELIT